MTLFSALVGISQRVAQTPGRNAKVAAIAQFLRTLAPAEIGIAVAFLSGVTRQGRIGIGHALFREAQPATVTTSPSLSLIDVDTALQRICEATGSGSQARRAQLLGGLLARAGESERDLLYRLIQGELRQGALESLMIDAVANAAELPVDAVHQAAMVAHGVVSVAEAVLTEGREGLDRFALEVLQPIAPMLAKPASDIAEALRAFGTAAFEWKLDGARVHVHKSGRDVRVFTRSRNDVTASAPEIVESMQCVPARELILDGEAIALRPDGAPQPFQTTMRRFGRTVDVAAMRETLPLSVFFFDCLRVDAHELTASAASQRFDALAAALPEALVMPRVVTADLAVAEAFYADALARGHEGVMAKALDARYEPGRRSGSWLKIKRLHTLDLVVLAAEWGHGRRHGTLSNLHLAARDAVNGGFVMLGKTFKGMTDAMLVWQTAELLARETHRDEWTVHVRPELVVEIAFNDLQASPRYPGGLALRFARVKRYRMDKRAADADTIDTVRAIYEGQIARASRV